MEDLNISITNHSNSSIYSYCKYREPDTDHERIAKHTVYLILNLMGIFGNVFVIILAVKYTVRKNLHHLIINMAVSDSLFLFTQLFARITWLLQIQSSIYGNGLLGIIVCKILNLMFMSSHRVSVITLLVISIERFRATRHTMVRTRQYTFKKRITVICVCWLIPMPFAAYYAYAICVAYSGESFVWHFTLAGEIVLVILCCIIFVLSIITMRRLSRPQAIQSHLNEQQRKIRTHRAQAAVRMVLVSVLLYTCCWLPVFTNNALWSVEFLIPTVKIIDTSVCTDWRSFFYVIYRFLPVVNSCFSPLIYIIFMPDFRQAAKKVFCRTDTQQCQAPNRQNSILPELQAIPDRPRLPDYRESTYDN